VEAVYIWLERTAFSIWLRESPSLFAFPAVLILHTVGMAFLVGASGAISLCILGFAPQLSLSSLKKIFPILWVAFAINFLSGVGLLMAFPAKALTNLMFYAKLVFIALALLNYWALKKQLFGNPLLDKTPVSTNNKILAITSLFFWIGATTSGRLLAYTYSRVFAQ